MMSFLGIKAQTYDFLTFQSTTGEKSVKAIGTVITFEDGIMKVKNLEEEYSLSLSQLQKIYFSDTPASVENISVGEDNSFSVYAISGQFVGIYSKLAEIEKLPKGIYVVKGTDTTSKITVR